MFYLKMLRQFYSAKFEETEMAPVFHRYHPPSQKDEHYFYHMGKAIDTYYQIYDKFLLTGDFNVEDTEPCLSQFLFEYDANNLVNET